MKHSDIIGIYFPIFITYLALILTNLGYNESWMYITIFIIIAFCFLISYRYLIENPPLEFKGDIEQENRSMKFGFNFKNNTKNPITIRWYQFEVTKDDRTTQYNRHTYGRIIRPSKEWQQEDFGWTSPQSYDITEGGRYQILSIVGFILDGEYKQ